MGLELLPADHPFITLTLVHLTLPWSLELANHPNQFLVRVLFERHNPANTCKQSRKTTYRHIYK